MCINMQGILRGNLLLTHLAPCLINPSKKSETQKKCRLYESLALQQLSPKSYKKYMKLPYDPYYPLTAVNSAKYVCPKARQKNICTTKELLKFHLCAAQHHSYETDQISVKDTIPEHKEIFMVQDIVDQPCLIYSWYLNSQK